MTAQGGVEAALETTGHVFFYVGPFRYPRTAFGLLFSPDLETAYKDNAAATPFDSGGLIDHYRRPDEAESPRDFLLRHELPVPEHRRYLRLTMNTLFEEPMHYVHGIDPRLHGPIELIPRNPECDQRIWTHEVRVPNSVPLRNRDLKAVFVLSGRGVSDPAVEQFLQWCKAERVTIKAYATLTSRDREFELLQRTCVKFIREELGR